jgi:hypothetical protein
MSDQDLQPVPDDLNFGPTIRGFVGGQTLARRYALGRILGRGGMGVVWLARDEELERDVAIKFLPELLTLDKEAISDLKRETRRSLELTHPNIVRIYDFVQDTNWAGISMEYVEGDTLSALKVEQPGGCFDVETLAPWLKQLINALVYAHEEARVVHRDLKPANLMIDVRGRLKVADFGIARSVSDSVSRVTMARSSGGTLVYMSPQQAMGEPASVTDDVYALGATLYDLLTGKPPFYTGDVLAQLREKAPPSLATRRTQFQVQGKAEIPEAWEQTITACLAKEPAQRPQSIAEVGERLGLRAPSGAARAAAPSAGEIKPPETPLAPQPTPSPKPSGKGGLIAVVVALVLLLGGVGYYFGVYLPADQARQAEIAKEEAIEKEKEAEAQAAADAAKKAQLEADAQKAAEAAEALRTQQEKQAEEAARLANARGGLMIKTDPEGATVALGGEDVQTSPATFKSIKLGTYPIHVALDGYEPVDQSAEIKENEFTDLGTITLVRSKGNLQIVTTPPDADYTISNTALGINQSGKAPDTLKDLPVGTYDVTVTRGDWTLPGTATVKRNDTVVYSPAFTYGSAAITSDPTGADVTENGKHLGVTPVTLKDLRTGSHTFTLMLPGYQNSTVSADVGSNTVATVSATLAKILLGTVSITSEPSGASVSENGDDVGETPLVLNNLSPGHHIFKLTHSGYSKGSVSAEVTPGETQAVSATLERRSIFAGTWVGTVFMTASDGSSSSFVMTIVVSEDETSLTWTNSSNVQNQVNVQRNGNTLTWNETLKGDADYSAECKTTLEIAGDGTTATYNRTSRVTSGRYQGNTGNETGTFEKR